MLEFCGSKRLARKAPVQFASFAYLAYLALVTMVYFALPWQHTRTVWLLVASLAFYYALSAGWTIALVAVIVLGYILGLIISATPTNSNRRRVITGAGVTLIVAVLAFFKYAKLTAPLMQLGLVSALGDSSFSTLHLILPIGMSFWTFMTISYLVDVSKGTTEVERNPLRYALFVGFFPHVTAGPIARASQLMPQLKTKRVFSYELMRSGLWLMGWGFVKKLLVADPLGKFVDLVYGHPRLFGAHDNGLVLLLATVGFAIQIYCDFSGYTDIVRGSARILGFDLLPNFNRPYFSRSVKEFWQRWHMSLMGWLKVYVYFPLGGSRVPTWRRYLNIFIVFAVSGIWHGAGLSFLVWGLLNAFYQVFGEVSAPLRARVRAALRVDTSAWWYRVFQSLVTFGLISIAWVFFRAGSIQEALYIVPRMFMPTFAGVSSKALAGLKMPREQALLTVIAILVVFAVDALSTRINLAAFVRKQPLPIRWAGYLAAIFIITVFGYYGPAYDVAGFAYFRF